MERGSPQGWTAKQSLFSKSKARGVCGDSLQASSPIWVSEASLVRTRERAAKRSREAHLACLNRRACLQARVAREVPTPDLPFDRSCARF